MFPFKFFRKKTPEAIEKKIGYVFKDRVLLQTALTHRSAAKSQNESYERLEFLGDAILDLVISDHLYQKHPTKSEGQLTQMRSMLVNAKTLHEVAKSIQLQQDLNVDKSIDLDNSPTQQNLLSCSLEAIIGAIYLDRGMHYAEKFIRRFIISNKEREAIPSEYNYKGQLLEYCQKNGINPPEFRTENVDGPDHARHYTIVVYIDNVLYGTGTGTTKRIAEQQASEEAYKNLFTTK
ncbi:MAG: ribonuclease III [Candidatus Marinimicrobia bacterium]|nr:ribonuclease III [Candidatus Neomarinimicrobiota bacterium]